MKSILLLARITFIYNICLLVTLILRYYDFIADVLTKSTIIVAGYILSLIGNIALCIFVLTLLASRKSLDILRPRWLFIANALVFIIQIFFLIR